MKCFKRYFCAFLCCLLLSVAFSTIVSASETIIEDTKIKLEGYINQPVDGEWWWLAHDIYPNNGEVETYNTNMDFNGSPLYEADFFTRWIVLNKDNNTLISKGKTYNISLENGYHNIGYVVSQISNNATITSKYLSVEEVTVLVTYTDNSSEYFAPTEIIENGRNLNITFSVTPEKDIKSIEYQIYSTPVKFDNPLYKYRFFINSGEYVSDNSFVLIAESQSEEAGLLSGLLGIVKGIKDGMSNITSGITNAISKIGEVVNGITELPSKLWSLISEGLRNLFVPTEEQLTQFKTDMDSLLESKLGALYEVGDLLINSLRACFESVEYADPLDTIAIPEVSIPLPGGESFSFGGYDVKIIPDGFEWIVDAVKAITGVVFTLYFVNGLRKRYDEIMGGN